jgi:hypothetical protein
LSGAASSAVVDLTPVRGAQQFCNVYHNSE